MSLNQSVVGLASASHSSVLGWEKVALYALGVGATTRELDLIYERPSMRALCTMAVVPAAPAMREVLLGCGGDLTQMVHHAQTVTQHAPLPIGASVHAKCTVTGLYDLRRFAMLQLSTELVDDAQMLLSRTQSSLLFLNGGGFGGEAPPRGEKAASPPADMAPHFVVQQVTSAEQAALYRLSGDTNPLHIDPEFAAKIGFTQGPVLHGLATYGYAARHLEEASGKRVMQLEAQFKKPVWPGEVLCTEIWDLGEAGHVWKTSVPERHEVVATGVARLA